MNAAYLNKGIVVTKFTGSRGKSGTSDASADMLAGFVKYLMMPELCGRWANLARLTRVAAERLHVYCKPDVDVIDVGVPVLSMHSPFEVVSKLDVYMAFKVQSVFLAE
jgi:aspartyl aminopeptidase